MPMIDASTYSKPAIAAGRSSTVRSFKDVHHPRNLHLTHACAAAGRGRKTFANGDEWWRVGPIRGRSAGAYSADSVGWMVGTWGLEPQTSTVSILRSLT